MMSSSTTFDQNLESTQKPKLRNAFKGLKAHACKVANFTLQWQDLEDHLRFIHSEIESKLQQISAVKAIENDTNAAPSKDLILPESKDPDAKTSKVPVKKGKELILYVKEHLKDHELLHDYLFKIFNAVEEPGKIVLEAVKEFYFLEDADMRKSCRLVLGEFRRFREQEDDDVAEEVRKEAKRLAVEWKGKLKIENSLEVLMFLLLLIDFGLVGEFAFDEIFKLFDYAQGRKPELFRALGLADKAPVMASLDPNAMKDALMSAFKAKRIVPSTYSIPEPMDPSKTSKRKRVKITDPKDDLIFGLGASLGGMSNMPPESSEPILSAGSDVLTNPLQQRIFRPNWDLKENESALSSSASAKKFIEKVTLPADEEYVSKLAIDNFVAESAQAAASGLIFFSEMIKRHELFVRTEAQNISKIASLETDSANLRFDNDVLTDKLNCAQKSAEDNASKVSELARQLQVQEEKHRAEMEAQSKALMDGLTMAYELAFEAVKKQVLSKYSDLDMSDITIEAALAAAPSTETDDVTLDGEEEEVARFQDGVDSAVKQEPRGEA